MYFKKIEKKTFFIDVKPYACQYCDQSFRTNGRRKTHEKSHLNNQRAAEDPAKLAGVKLIKYMAEQMETNELSKDAQTADEVGLNEWLGQLGWKMGIF